MVNPETATYAVVSPAPSLHPYSAPAEPLSTEHITLSIPHYKLMHSPVSEPQLMWLLLFEVPFFCFQDNF